LTHFIAAAVNGLQGILTTSLYQTNITENKTYQWQTGKQIIVKYKNKVSFFKKRRKIIAKMYSKSIHLEPQS